MRPNESFIEQPIRSLETMLRILAEDDQRYPSVIPDGIYGPDTMQAVSAFQRINGLQATGVTDQETWAKIVDASDLAQIRIGKAESIEIIMDPGKEYILGDSSPYIYLLQSMLTQLSNDHPTIIAPGHSGILDNETSASISAFQELSALPITGRLDKVTWKHIARQFTLNAHHNEAQNKYA